VGARTTDFRFHLQAKEIRLHLEPVAAGQALALIAETFVLENCAEHCRRVITLTSVPASC
jgi:hypothetical protein